MRCVPENRKRAAKKRWNPEKHRNIHVPSLSLSPPVYTFYIIYIHIYDIYVYDTWYIYIYVYYIYICIWFGYMVYVYIYTMFYSWYIIIYTCVCDIISVPLGQSWLNGFYFMHMKLLKHPYFRTRRHTPPDGRASRRCVLANDGGSTRIPGWFWLMVVDVDSPIKVEARLHCASRVVPQLFSSD